LNISDVRAQNLLRASVTGAGKSTLVNALLGYFTLPASDYGGGEQVDLRQDSVGKLKYYSSSMLWSAYPDFGSRGKGA
jgi:predicted GTPase